MITRYHIDASLGRDDQVGLFVQGDEQEANQFRFILYHKGFHTLKYMPSRRPGFDFFTYVYIPQSAPNNMDKYERLEAICQANKDATAHTIPGVPDYKKWREVFNDYVEAYRRRSVPQVGDSSSPDFDKKRAYDLIKSGHYEEAEHYLEPFINDTPPALLPAYLVYLHHEWNRPEDVIISYEQYASHFQAGDVDRRVIEWIVSAYLQVPSPNPERALFILNDFLPEFQRQGVAEKLLNLRAQARVLQGRLPQTTADLRRYLTQTASTILAEQLDDLLDVITGLAEDTTTVDELLSQLANQVEEGSRWPVWLAQANVARRSRDFDTALSYLQQILDTASATLSAIDLASVRLNMADLHLKQKQPSAAVQILHDVPHQDLMLDEQRAFWGLYGRGQIATDDEEAQTALLRAYEMGSTHPEVLRPLAQMAYRSGNLSLAQNVYKDLREFGFEPTVRDHLYTGILAWLEGEVDMAFRELNQLVDTPFNLLPIDTPTLAYEAFLDSLEATNASEEEIFGAYNVWLDWLVAQNDRNELLSVAKRIAQSGLDSAVIFALLEAAEPVLAENRESRTHLGQIYVNLLCQEVDWAIRQERPLPNYTNDLRRALFTLDRQQFDFAQEYLQEEIKQAREADIETDLAEELETEPALDLRDYWVALVGGYAPVRRRVRERLEQEYNLGRFAEVPPSWEAHVNQARVAEAVSGADLIVVVHRCIKHDGTDALKAAIGGTEVENQVHYASGKGQSSILRTIENFFKG